MEQNKNGQNINNNFQFEDLNTLANRTIFRPDSINQEQYNYGEYYTNQNLVNNTNMNNLENMSQNVSNATYENQEMNNTAYMGQNVNNALNMNEYDYNNEHIDEYEDMDNYLDKDNINSGNKFSIWIKKHKAASIFIAIAILLLIGAGTVFAIITKDKDNTDTLTEANNTVGDSGEVIEDSEVPLSEEEDVNAEVDKLYEELNSEEALEKTMVKTSVTNLSKVKIAPVDDSSDPQPKQNIDSESNNAGSVVNVSDATEKNSAIKSTTEATIGIDVSKWQGEINWSKVAASGVEYAIIRIGYRTTVTGEVFEDPFALYNMQQAQKAGIKLGVYFYSTALSEEEAKAEAEWTCKQIAQYQITYPVVFDYEGYESSSNRNYGLSSLERTEIAKAFLNVVKSKGYTPMMYASKSALENDYNTATISGSYKIWVSQYPSVPYPDTAKSSYTKTHSMWQYTSKGKVDGINGYVDVNVAYFGYETAAQAKDSSTPATATLDPEIGITFKTVNEQVTPKIYVNVRSVPNSVDSSTVVATVKNGEVLTRTGIGDNGWSRLEYNGQKVYAVTSYLTTNLQDNSQAIATDEPSGTITNQPSTSTNNSGLPSGFSKISVQVTPKDKVNLRTSPSATEGSSIVVSVSNGEVLDKIGENSASGWSAISYNGQNVYAITSYLTTDLSFKPTVATLSPSDGYTSVNEQVTAKSETNLRSVATASGNDTIVHKLTSGEYVTRTGINSSTGWSRLEYNGQTVYAITSYLTTQAVTVPVATEKPVETTESSSTTVTETTTNSAE